MFSKSIETSETIDGDHGRIETREYSIVTSSRKLTLKKDGLILNQFLTIFEDRIKL